jgi:DNA polymerase III subunit delta'
VTLVTPAPWVIHQTSQLLARKGQAWLLQGPSGLGQYSLALAVVQAWLCDEPTPQGGCGHCASCHAIEVRTHSDLCVLMPETDMMELGWPLSEKAQSEIDEKKRKPSREIRIEAMRDAVEFAQRTSARGRGKAILIFPAERMNSITANALLKTLEEPPGDVRFVLASEAAHQLLPTIRSRCQVHTMAWPDESASLSWMRTQSLADNDAAVLLRASGGRPQEALNFAAAGRDPGTWASLPKSLAKGEMQGVKDWSASELIDAMQKLCHDLLVLGTGGKPRFFEAADLPKDTSHAAISAWNSELARCRRTSEHPFNAGLMLEALVSQAQTALNSRPASLLR